MQDGRAGGAVRQVCRCAHGKRASQGHQLVTLPPTKRHTCTSNTTMAVQVSTSSFPVNVLLFRMSVFRWLPFLHRLGREPTCLWGGGAEG